MKIKIRTVSTEDTKELLDIYSYYVNHTAVTFEVIPPSPEEFQERISRTLKRYPFIAAEVQGKILGYASAGSFKDRAAYDWCVETTIYVAENARRMGIGSLLQDRLEDLLRQQKILNANACIAVPREEEDEYLTFDSVRFHERKGYKLAATFHDCGYKFHRWYNMVWMEKMLGDHVADQQPIIPFFELKPSSVSFDCEEACVTLL